MIMGRLAHSLNTEAVAEVRIKLVGVADLVAHNGCSRNTPAPSHTTVYFTKIKLTEVVDFVSTTVPARNVPPLLMSRKGQTSKDGRP